MEGTIQGITPREQRSWGHLRIVPATAPQYLLPSSLPADDLTSYFTEKNGSNKKKNCTKSQLHLYPHILPLIYYHKLSLLLSKTGNFSCTLNLIIFSLLKVISSTILPSLSFIFQVSDLYRIIPISIHTSVFFLPS